MCYEQKTANDSVVCCIGCAYRGTCSFASAQAGAKNGMELPAASNVIVYKESVVDNVGLLTGYIDFFIPYSKGVANLSSVAAVDILSGEEVCKVPPEWTQWMEDSSRTLYRTAFDNEDKLFAVTFEPGRDGKLHISGAEGEDIALEGWKGLTTIREDGYAHPNSPRKFAADETYFYLLSQISEGGGPDVEQLRLQVFTRDGALYSEYKNVYDFAIDQKGGLYIIDPKGLCFEKYKVQDTEKLYQTDTKQGETNFTKICYDNENDFLYALSWDDAKRYNGETGNFVSATMSMTRDAIYLSSDGIFKMAVVGGEKLLIYSIADADNVLVYQYAPESDKRADMKPTLTISAPYPEPHMTKAITLYEHENPDSKIAYECAYNSYFTYAKNAESYQAKTTTRILSGDIGDIVMADARLADIYYMHSKDLFLNLKPMIDADKELFDIPQRMLDAITVDGKIRGLPMTANYYYAIINLDLCEKLKIDIDWENAKWSEVIALSEQLQGSGYHLSVDGARDRFFVRMLISNMPDLINLESKTVNLRQDWFLDLLEQYRLAETPEFWGDSYAELGVVPENSIVNIQGMTEALMSHHMAHLFEEEYQNGVRTKIVPLFEGEKNHNRTAGSSELYSVMYGSENKNEAVDFLRFLMALDTNTISMATNVPFNMRQRTNRFEREKERVFRFHDPKIIDLYYDEMDVVYAAVDTLYDMGKVKPALYTPLLKYLSGEMTLDDALTQAEEQIYIQINE